MRNVRVRAWSTVNDKIYGRAQSLAPFRARPSRAGRFMNHWSVLRLVRMLPGPNPHNPYFDPAKRHHTQVGFRNNHSRAPPTREELARLHRDLEAKAPASAPRVDLWPVAPDLALLQANRTRHVTSQKELSMIQAGCGPGHTGGIRRGRQG